jgi:hypothetical protein
MGGGDSELMVLDVRLVLQSTLGPTESAVELFGADGFQQVVDGIGFKGCGSVLYMGGRKNNRRNDSFGCHSETVETRHVDVEEDDFGAMRLDRAQGLQPVRRLRHNFDVWHVTQESAQALPCQALIIDDQNPHRPSGMRSSHSNPPPVASRTTTELASP